MRSAAFSSARRRPLLAWICLALFLLLLSLSLASPGAEIVRKADASAFYLAALSLWHDGDLVCDDGDARRLFHEYPGTDNLLLMSQGQGETVYFGVPLTYPLVASPFVALLGARGMVLLNAMLLTAMVWMGISYLRRDNSQPLSTLFATGFFLSTAPVYVLWLQAEIFNMACVTAAFFLIERAFGDSRGPRSAVSGRRLMLHAAGSAALLATAAYSKPMLAALALPMLYLLLAKRSWRGLTIFAASGLVTVAALAATADALTEEPWPYFAHRMSFGLSSPIAFEERQAAPRFYDGSPVRPSRQVLRAGEQFRVTMTAILADATSEFLFGRHGGFVVYMPFAVLCILLFLLGVFLFRERRSAFRWLILAGAVLTAILFITLVRGNWLGGGGSIGNRLFLTAYPCFLFLVRRIRPPWLTAAGFAAAGLCLGPLLIDPGNDPTLQAHVTHRPFSGLPLEWSLADRLSGYQRFPRGDVVFHGRHDEIAARDDEIWVAGARRVEVHLLDAEPRRGFVFDVRNLAPENEIELCLQRQCRRLAFGDVPAAGSVQRVTFTARDGDRVPRADSPSEAFRYRLTVAGERGEQPRWRGSGSESFYLGAALVLLGSPDDLERDLYDAEWLSFDAPETMAAGEAAAVPVAVRNASSHVWPSAGPARVRLAYHWLGEDGAPVVWEGRRTELPADVAAGGRIEAEVRVDAPGAPGRYLLALDLVRERVRWFSDTSPESTPRLTVEVTGPSQAPER